MNQIIAEVRFTTEIASRDAVRVGVVKAQDGTGILVWLGPIFTEYGRPVIVRCDIGDGMREIFRGTTVGNLYGYSVSETEASRAARDKWHRKEAERNDRTRDEKIALQMEYIEVLRQQERQLIGGPVLEACKKLGVTKLRRHSGNFPRTIDGLEIEMIEEEETICVDL